MFGMIILTLLFAPLLLIARFKAIYAGQMSIKSFELYDGTGATVFVTKTTRHLANLFEMPILFYVACLTAAHLQINTTILVGLAWCYALFRAVQAFIHLTYNKVLHRLAAFMLSNFALYAMWIIIILHGVN